MKQPLARKSIAFILLQFSFLFFTLPSFAEIYSVPLDDRIKEAQHIVVATLIDKEPYWDEAHKGIYTSNRLHVKAYLKGYSPDSTSTARSRDVLVAFQ